MDVAGNVSALSSPASITIDTVAPTVTANSSTTSDTAPPLSGTINDPTATIHVTLNGASYAAINSGNGAWTIAENIISPLAPGSYSVSVAGTDLAGNVGTASASLLITAPPTIIDVDASATGLNDGKSWEDAYTTLSPALAQLTGPGTIDVAQGTYKPTASTDRTISFVLKSGVAIYGGYAGASTSTPGLRDVTNYPTILSGDIGSAGNSADNSYHVIAANGADATAILDGFTITGGNADGSPLDSAGGGLRIDNGGPTINNCIFTGNSASLDGGAIFDNAGSPTVTNCVFKANIAEFGGAVEIDFSSAQFTDCVFNGNKASSAGGAMDNDQATITLSSCSFSGNTATAYDGGAINNYDHCSLTATNCTFAGNSSLQQAGGAIANDYYCSTILTNCILWGDFAPASSEIFNQDFTSTATAAFSDIQSDLSGATDISADPKFIRNPSPGGDGVWGSADDDDGDLHLQMTSPAIDAGSNAAVPSGATDADGNQRIFDFPGVNDPGAIVDMGAYELGTNLDAITVPAGQTLSLPGGGYTFTVDQFTVGSEGTLNLGSDTLVIQYAAGSDPVSSIASLLASAYANGQWTGAGITSSLIAGASSTTGVGYFDNGSQITIARAWDGDANLDGVINADDLALMLLGQSQGGTRWQDGNFNYDNQVNADDLIKLMYALAVSNGQMLKDTSLINSATKQIVDPSVNRLMTNTGVPIFAQNQIGSEEDLGDLLVSPQILL